MIAWEASNGPQRHDLFDRHFAEQRGASSQRSRFPGRSGGGDRRLRGPLGSQPALEKRRYRRHLLGPGLCPGGRFLRRYRPRCTDFQGIGGPCAGHRVGPPARALHRLAKRRRRGGFPVPEMARGVRRKLLVGLIFQGVSPPGGGAVDRFLAVAVSPTSADLDRSGSSVGWGWSCGAAVSSTRRWRTGSCSGSRGTRRTRAG